MQATVVIPTRNRKTALLDTLDSVVNQTYPPTCYEVIVVDSSTDDTPRLVQEYVAQRSGPPEVHFLREERVGLHYAKNRAVQASRGEIVATIEDDAVADENWLAELLKPFDDPQVACCGGKVLPRWEVPPPSWIEPYYPALTIFSAGDEIKEMDRPWLVGCNIAVRRAVLFQVGGYNPDIIGPVLLGDGETGLQRKILRAKAGKLIYTPHAITWHWVPARRLTLDYMRWRFYNDGSCTAHGLYQEEHPGPAGLLLHAGKRTFYAVVHKTLAFLHAPRRRADYYRHELLALNNWRQVLYFLQLSYDRSFREFATREDWINE